MTLVTFIENLTSTVTEIGWSLFILAWAIGWALRGSPIPIFRIKRGGQDLLEDAIIAAFFLAIGSTIFYLISYIASQVS
ncbi:DNA import protein CedA1 [Sulfolobus acidocaldarius]|uniref:DNA import protein CedA1 n=4 Tax=Sulfolobus acidocaldarius TaxID=2285 RepID=CEDA1_SULAC|nr:DNA import protein CedA1 [Sulfolobus acidocaldarius]Q4JB68.1 RecName: Full=DNA import protein CedA1; AltName: Full=Crenarchaeal system for exchange of DNA protein A1 [Sulfolobus acidocaldarius DSM 639]AHC50975.1 hypothetical protein SUSAZ_02565 [Sulfolobus acidocaldarius SUSAZ]AAY79961.1 conserved protein [Sulfolobus acidocaldarius DSM 639]AGE70530.1 hypothetical protein SacN8_02760 [Sulfolobus acidocaldarius N8]AGE72803.1 hypothetical protein SacRon12I_02750 [Sulfolobus acidocaldarius Ron1